MTIIGSDLRMVEKTTGWLTRGRAIAAGAAGVPGGGLFVGLLCAPAHADDARTRLARFSLRF